MRICIPTRDDRGFESAAFDHFGRAPYLTIVDTDTGTLTVVRNPECHDHPRSCHHVPILGAHSVDAVVCNGLGRQAHAGLQEAGIDVLVAHGETVSAIVESVTTGVTRRLSPGDACGGGRWGHHRHPVGPAPRS